ncbi:hypothetical protein TRICHSKD4_4449 [Roseibium sp. TrichSKD4]|nr:hypothetical protein TRICHSKD4_4449 [Roseibium sp. TrichSKD4]
MPCLCPHLPFCMKMVLQGENKFVGNCLLIDISSPELGITFRSRQLAT